MALMADDGQSPTSIEAFIETIRSGDDVRLRRRVAAELYDEPRTLHELSEDMDATGNAISPRLNELVRMGCAERTGKRRNPSGHKAFVNELTPRGERYVRGEIDPEPGPPVSELKKRVVDTARDHLRGEATEDALRMAVLDHDEAKRSQNPDWTPGG